MPEVAPTADPTTEADQMVGRFVELWGRKRQLREELKETDAELRQLDEAIRENVMAPLGLLSLRRPEGTLSIRRDVRASGGGDRAKATEALKRAGYAEYVSENFNSQSVSALVRELLSGLDESHDEETLLNLDFDDRVKLALGEELAEHLTVTEAYSLTFSAAR